MTNVKALRLRMKKLKKPAIWQLTLILVVFIIISATFLRLNNIGMVERRNAVIEADKTGDDNLITQRLYDLQKYVSTHMNTDLGRGIELSETFKKDLSENISLTQQPSNINIYKQANETCQAKKYQYLSQYRQCMYDFIDSIPGGNVISSTIISEDEMRLVYIHNYLSPLWSPDLAGFAVVISIILLIIITIRLISELILSLLLKKYAKSK